MVNRMFPFPMMVWGESEHAGYKSKNVICPLGFEKGTMPAVMKDNEGTNEKETCQH